MRVAGYVCRRSRGGFNCHIKVLSQDIRCACPIYDYDDGICIIVANSDTCRGFRFFNDVRRFNVCGIATCGSYVNVFCYVRWLYLFYVFFGWDGLMSNYFSFFTGAIRDCFDGQFVNDSGCFRSSVCVVVGGAVRCGLARDFVRRATWGEGLHRAL